MGANKKELMKKSLEFKIEKKVPGALARAGQINTSHGVILTPSFVVVGTKATVKSVPPDKLIESNVQVVLANTYHLYLQPGDEIVRDAGGLNKFMNWKGPSMTDSGGFQVFSLGVAYGKEMSKILKVTDPSLLIPERFDDSDAPRLAKIGQDGVSFKSHLDGSMHYITPEKSIEIQHNLGADIIFAFDECTSPAEDLKYQEEALNRTHAWAKRSLKRHKQLEEEKVFNSPLEEYPKGEVENSNASTPSLRATPQEGNKYPQALFGIVQGGRDENLRKKSAEFIGAMDFDGFGIGGSFAKEDMSTAVKWVNEILPEEKPRHLLGIGEPEDLFMGVENGVDLFDCVLPTRLGRNGSVYTKYGKIIMTNKKYRDDFTPIEESCECYACKGYTRAYIAHLFHGKEMLAGTLASIHNIYFINKLVSDIRQSILDDTFFEFKKEFLDRYKK
jgi:queuine tRNA-ribosyltransferase